MSGTFGRSRSVSAHHHCAIAEGVMAAVTDIMTPARHRRVEGVSYLLGRTDGLLSTILSAVAVSAQATFGSFFVPSKEMVRVVTAADGFGLQVVGQIHTHPAEAFHSDGDDEGAQIRFDGFVSIVVPDYGDYLPSLRGGVVYVYCAGGFMEVPADHVHIVRART